MNELFELFFEGGIPDHMLDASATEHLEHCSGITDICSEFGQLSAEWPEDSIFDNSPVSLSPENVDVLEEVELGIPHSEELYPDEALEILSSGGGIEDETVSDDLADRAEDTSTDDAAVGVGESGNFPEEEEELLGQSSPDDITAETASDIEAAASGGFAAGESVVDAGAFSSDGKIDNQNNMTVVGEVVEYINCIDQQTGPTCVLMAQEQILQRHLGGSIPESFLERLGELMGVYSPCDQYGGANADGETVLLDIAGISYERVESPTLSDILQANTDNHMSLVGVDARIFYNNPTISPTTSGHQVAVVGHGVDPATGEIGGLYVTDSNFGSAARLVNLETFNNSWMRDQIKVPNPQGVSV